MPDMFTLEETEKFCVWNKWPRLLTNILSHERKKERKKKKPENDF